MKFRMFLLLAHMLLAINVGLLRESTVCSLICMPPINQDLCLDILLNDNLLSEDAAQDNETLDDAEALVDEDLHSAHEDGTLDDAEALVDDELNGIEDDNEDSIGLKQKLNENQETHLEKRQRNRSRSRARQRRRLRRSIITIATLFPERRVFPSMTPYFESIVSNRRVFRSAYGSQLTNDVCSICLGQHDATSVNSVSCHHTFHPQCILECFANRPRATNTRCPVCNQDLMEPLTWNRTRRIGSRFEEARGICARFFDVVSCRSSTAAVAV